MTNEQETKTQVGNLLNVLKIFQGQYVLGRTRQDGAHVPCTSLNPLMRDGGFQFEFSGNYLFRDRGSCERRVETLAAKGYKGYFALPAEEWVMQTRLEVAGRPSLREVLERNPEYSFASAEPIENMPENWVIRLDDDEPVDIVLDRRGDGWSEDCVATSAGELVSAGYGQCAFEFTGGSATVFAATRERYEQIVSAIS